MTNSRSVAHNNWMAGCSLSSAILVEAISIVRVLKYDYKLNFLTATEQKYDKMGMENCLPTGIEMEFSRLVTYDHNQYTIISCYRGEL